MDKEMQERIALFRFGLISSLVSHKGLSRGEQELRIGQITSRTWQIPGSPRSTIARSTLLRWLAVYQQSGCQLESLKPHPRADRGHSRVIDGETEGALVTLRREMPAVSLPVLVKLARSRRIIPADRTPSKDSLYRLFKRHGLDKDMRLPTDRRRFETELVNDLWQSDCMHGPRIIHEGKLRKSFLFAIIDDHSRLIPEILPIVVDGKMKRLLDYAAASLTCTPFTNLLPASTRGMSLKPSSLRQLFSASLDSL